jgi:hypothetical protein
MNAMNFIAIIQTETLIKRQTSIQIKDLTKELHKLIICHQPRGLMTY